MYNRYKRENKKVLILITEQDYKKIARYSPSDFMALFADKSGLSPFMQLLKPYVEREHPAKDLGY